ARVAARGFTRSISASAQRLKAIAADRAATMQTTIQNNTRHGGRPPAASIAPVSANGSANMECSHLIISSVVPRRLLIPRVLFPRRPHAYRRETSFLQV